MGDVGFNTGLRALLSARFALDTAGHNIANASTPGYSRQRVDLAASHPLSLNGMQIGTGVEALAVRRNADALLQRRIFTQTSVVGSLGARGVALSEMEGLFNEPTNGLGSLMNSFFSKVSDLSAEPEDAILRTGMVASAQDLAANFHQLRGQISDMRSGIAQDIEAKVEQVNELAAQVSALNGQIGQSEAGGATANDLRDAREQALRQMSQLVDVKTTEDSRGVVRVLVSGSLIVDSGQAHALQVQHKPDGSLDLSMDGVTGSIPLRGGELGGLYDVYRESAPSAIADIDRVAHNLILEVNRAHATGIPKSGGFKAMMGNYRVADVDKDGKLEDELLSNAGLPFDVESGSFYVNVSDEATGNLQKHRVEISSTHTTVGDLVDQLNALPHLSAELDALGRLRISAEAGYEFDFSKRIDAKPDDNGLFGDTHATLGAGGAGPYALADGDTLDLSVGGGAPISISFDQADFANIGAATADEIAAVINSDPAAQAGGIGAVAQNGQLFLKSDGEGTATSFTLQGGSSLAVFGWSALSGQPIAGSGDAVSVDVSGEYKGSSNGQWTFRATGDGQVGSTPGLKVDVFDQSGAKIATLDVGEGYQPGSPLVVADGVSVSFGIGDLSQTHGDAFSLDVVAEPDSTDALVALGLNGFFTGSDASDIAVREDIAANPELIAASASGAIGDGGALLDVLDVQAEGLEGLGGDTLTGAYGSLVGSVGFQVSTNEASTQANQTLLDSLDNRREEISGVNVDEEMVRVMQLQQAYTASVQYISTLNELQRDLMNLI